MRCRPLFVAALLLALGCSGRGSEHGPGPGKATGPLGMSATLGGDVVARVGDQPIQRSLVQAVAASRGIPPAEATRLLVEEALLAEVAVRTGALDDRVIRARNAAALARALLARFLEEARALGPFTDEEIEAVMGDDWIELDRPETRIVAHALVRKGAPDGEALARKLRAKLATAASEADFMSAAKDFPVPDGVQRVVEKLDQPFTVAGKLAVPSAQSTLDVGFAKAAFQLAKVSDTSDVVETPFGWHVIRLLEIRPPSHVSRAAKIVALEPSMLRMRARPKYEALLARLRGAVPVQLVGTDADLVLPRVDTAAERPR